MSVLDKPLAIAWLGDDFTGSAAVLEVLEFAGLPSVLFSKIPTQAQRDRFTGLRAVGIATTARAQTPDWMQKHLPAIYDWLIAQDAGVVHYKTCSTLDSAPHIGSIGKAMEIGRESAGTHAATPILIAAPVMQRYQIFGHFFAGHQGQVHRLDRHPVMAHHPTTPMDESDVARHLAKQTDLTIGTRHFHDLETPLTTVATDAVTLDAVTMDDMARCGALIDQADPKFVVGSQGVEYALVEHWQRAGKLPSPKPVPAADPVSQMVVVSGSLSPTTAHQIAWAAQNGYDVLRLPINAILQADPDAIQQFMTEIDGRLAQGGDIVICSATSAQDPHVNALLTAAASCGMTPQNAREQIGRVLGLCLKHCFQRGIKRAVIAGGDSSGHALGCLDFYAFRARSTTLPGAPLLTAYSDDPDLDGIELALKGGQMGSVDYFNWIKQGAGPKA